MKKVLITATVQSHIAQFHKPLINMLKENGYEVHVAARDNLAEKNGLQLNEPDKVFNTLFDRSPLSKNNIIAYKQLKQIIDNTSYDIIHCNTPMGGVITRLAAKGSRKKGSKVFYTAHGFHFYKGGPRKNWIIYYPIEKFLSKLTDKLITITREDFNLANSKFDTEVVYIHGVGANSDRYTYSSYEEALELRDSLGYKQDQIIILCIGELNKNKNQITVINSISKAIDRIPNVKLLLAGNGPMEKELRRVVSELGLNAEVDFLGYRTDLEKYLNLCDLVISASIREGLPLNVMEAMLSGKPVIVSNNRGHRELVNNRINGLINEPYDIDGIVKSIVEIYENEKLRNEFIKNGLLSMKKFTYESVIRELKNIYKI